MVKLNQVIAVVPSKKSQAESVKTDIYHKAQKPELFSGLIKTYQSNEEKGEQQPSESKNIQCNMIEMIKEFANATTQVLDVVATQDTANCQAKSNIEVDGKVLLTELPVTYLLFLEKQLTDLTTFVDKLPILDPSETWTFDPNKNCYVSAPAATNRYKKVPFPFEKSPATDKHPAQVEVLTRDEFMGVWTCVKFSSAVPAKHKAVFADRVRKLKEAVVRAREEANCIQATNVSVGQKIFDYVFETVK